MESEPKLRRAAWRAFFLWLAVSLLFFGAAAYFTFVITAVESRSLFAGKPGESPSGNSLDELLAARQAQHPGQGIGIFIRNPRSDAMPTVQYSLVDDPERRAGFMDKVGQRFFSVPQVAYLTFDLPANSDAMIVVNRLVDAQACSSPRSASEVAAESSHEISVHHVKIEEFDNWDLMRNGADPHYLVIPEANGDFPVIVTCKVHSAAEEETFISRTATLTSTLLPMLSGNAPEHTNGTAKEYSAYKPVPFLLYTSAPYSDRPAFNGGFLAERNYGSEGARIFSPSAEIKFSWNDMRREQLRDVILVLIGTLVALGATTLIEGLRPVFELFNT